MAGAGAPPRRHSALDVRGIRPKRLGPGRLRLHREGFEFDSVGIIFGRDLRWDRATNDWIGDSGASHESMVEVGPMREGST